jgi:CheY-like chemotaxis protein
MQAKRILVVDDDAMVRESIEMMLELDGHTIELVGSGAEALARFAPGRYDVVLTDNRMPGMHGIELAQKIKVIDPAQIIVLFSGSPPVEAAVPCDLVLVKPFSSTELRKAVIEAADRCKRSAAVAG